MWTACAMACATKTLDIHQDRDQNLHFTRCLACAGLCGGLCGKSQSCGFWLVRLVRGLCGGLCAAACAAACAVACAAAP